jgi:hypothetical protein
MKQVVFVVLGTLLVATNAIHAQPVRSAPYTGTPAGTSSDDVVWSQLDEPSGEAFIDQAFEAQYAAYDNSGGDDFIYDGWSRYLIGGGFDSLFTPGSLSVPGASPLFVNVAFYVDAGGLPGAVLDGCDFPANTNFTSDNGDLTIDVEGCWPLGGHIWFSQQVRMDFNPFGQHYWATRASSNESPGVWKSPGDGFDTGCTDWQPANAVCGMPGEDWLFELTRRWGDPLEGVPATGPFGEIMLVLALGGGSAYVLRRRR